MSISEPFIRRPIGTSLLMLGVLVFGIGAYNLLPVAALPKVDFPTIAVQVTYPGASPDTMASAVATPLEQQFAALPGLAEMTSMSGIGATAITLQFDLERNIDGAAQDVQKIGGAQVSDAISLALLVNQQRKFHTKFLGKLASVSSVVLRYT